MTQDGRGDTLVANRRVGVALNGRQGLGEPLFDVLEGVKRLTLTPVLGAVAHQVRMRLAGTDSRIEGDLKLWGGHNGVLTLLLHVGTAPALRAGSGVEIRVATVGSYAELA